MTNCLCFQANSFWLYIVPWGMYKTVTYVKEQYGNPPIIISENGTGWKSSLNFFPSSLFLDSIKTHSLKWGGGRHGRSRERDTPHGIARHHKSEVLPRLFDRIKEGHRWRSKRTWVLRMVNSGQLRMEIGIHI